MKVSILIAILLLALCLSANGWWGGRRSSSSSRSSRSSRSSSSSSSSSPSNSRSSRRSWGWSRPRTTKNSPSSSKNTESDSVKEKTGGKGGVIREKAGEVVKKVIAKAKEILDNTKIDLHAEGEVNVKWKDVEASAHGSITITKDSKTNENDDSNKQRRSAQWPGYHYNITIMANPCSFNTYDNVDRDGTIDKNELHAIFGSTELADALFADLDEMDDGIVTEEDFNDMAPAVISACMDTKK